MRFSHTRRAEENNVLTVGDEATGRQLLDPLLVDGGLEVEIEVLKGFDEGELRQ